MSNAKEMMLEVFRAQGRNDALALRTAAAANEVDDTQIIDQERCVPAFDPTKDYSSWAAGSPVADEGQVWKLIQPYNAANHDGRPSTLRALWGLCHTKNPKKAKPWVDPFGTSGMYMVDECYKDSDGAVYCCKQDNTVHTASAYPAAWEVVEVGE